VYHAKLILPWAGEIHFIIVNHNTTCPNIVIFPIF